MSTLLLRVRRGRELLGSWRLDGAPIEMALIDEESGRVVGSFTAAGADREPEPETVITMPMGGLDELPVAASTERLDGDDFTMPLPEAMEAMEPTADLIPEATATDEGELAARLSLERPRPIPNLAARGAPPEASPQEAPGSVGDHPTQEASPGDSAGHETDDGVGVPMAPGRPVVGPPPAVAPPPEPDDLELEGLEDEPLRDGMRPTTPGGTVAAAEVWVRRQSEWCSGGSLQPGQRAVSRGGWVRLRRDGLLVVRPGPALSGSATLADGSAVEIDKDMPPLELPAGASVLLRAGEHGLYVRSEAWSGGGLPRLTS
ncbi:MAG: hypothetical protein VX265_01215 [Myxococcota bacterium]|nr:hypothetical protein [Myxococcota bacterium]